MHAWCEKGITISDDARVKVAKLNKESVKKILVIRHAALGDMVITRPFLVELRKLFPNAMITIDLVSQYQIGAPLDLVDQSHITFGQDMRDKGLLEKFKNFNEHDEYDLIFDLASTSRSQWIARLTKAHLKLGFPFRKMNWLYDISIMRSDFKFEGEALLDFLNLFGHMPQYPLNYAQASFERSRAQKRIAYFMGASIPEKCYPLDHFKELIQKMSAEYPDYQHCILQGAKSDEKYEDFASYFKEHQNVELTKLMSIESLVEWMSQTNLLVSNDTGVRNIAISTHTPTFGIFFEAIPFRYIPRYENIHEAILCTQKNIAEVNNVFESVQKLLSKMS